MSQGNIVLSISPLLTAIFAYFLLSETLRLRNIIALVGAFVGVFFVNITKASNSTHSTEGDKHMIGMILWFTCLAFHSPVGVCNRSLAKYVHSVYSPFYFSVGMFLSAFILFFFFRSSLNFEHYDMTTIILFTVSWVVTYISQSVMSFASKYEKAAILTSLTYFNSWMLLLIDWFLFHYEFKFIYFIGFSIVILSVVIPGIMTIREL